MKITKEQLWYITGAFSEDITAKNAKEEFDKRFTLGDDISYWRVAANKVNEIHETLDFDDMWEMIDLSSGLELMKLLRDGKKISAIKLIREQTGVSLKEAKAFVDSNWIWDIMSDLGIIRR